MRSQALFGILLIVAVLAGILGLVGILIGYFDGRIRAAGQETPREVTAAQLYANGPGDNAHVRLRLFALGDKYVYSTDNGSWTAVWLAVYPSEIEKEIVPKLFIRSNKVRNEDQLRTLVQETEFSGILLSSVPSHGADKNTEMQQMWPGVDWDQVIMLQEGREFPSAAWVNGAMGGGICLLLLTAICSVGCYFTRK